MKKKTKTRKHHFYNLLSAIGQSDVIIRDENNKFICLYYDSAKAEAPYVKCKESGTLSNCLYKYLETSGVPCLEKSLLTQELFANVEEGDMLPTIYYSYFAKIYCNLKKINENEDEIFHIRLSKDVVRQINQLERKICNKVLKRFRKNELIYSTNESGDVESILEKGFAAISNFNKLKFEKSYNEKYEVVEYCLGTEVRNYNIEFCFFIFVSKKENSIYVCTSAFTESFKIFEADRALNLVGELAKSTSHELIRSAEKYCKEFEINLRLYEQAYTSMKDLLEMNYQKTGTEYGFKTDTTVFEVYLKLQEQKSSMFFIEIICNEFLRNPNVFKEFITAPHKMKKWTFRCREEKYNQKKFDERFQPVTS